MAYGSYSLGAPTPAIASSSDSELAVSCRRGSSVVGVTEGRGGSVGVVGTCSSGLATSGAAAASDWAGPDTSSSPGCGFVPGGGGGMSFAVDIGF